MLLILVLILIFLCIILRLLLKNTIFNYWKKRNVESLKPNFIFGNIWEIITLRRTWSNFIYDVQTHCNGNRCIGIFKMFQPALIVCDLDLIKDILVKDFDHFEANSYFGDRKVDPIIAINPFLLKGTEWKDTRSLFTPQFTAAKMKLLCPLLQKVCKEMNRFVHNQANSEKSSCVELSDLTARYTGEAVMSCGYGLEANSFSCNVPDTFKISQSSADTQKTGNSLKQTLGIFSGSLSKMLNVTFYGEPVPQIFYNIILGAVKNRKENNLTRSDLLNHFIQLQNKLGIDNLELVGHAFTFFVDGYQTSYAALSYALLELSLNLDIQEIARYEVETVLEKYNGEMTFEAYKELHYIENVLLETLRKYPIITVMSKVCTKDYTVQDLDKGGSFTIEKGTSLYWSIQAVHHNPQYYPEPNKFDPDRFTEDAKQERPKYSFLGFGDGPRICIGRSFALLQLVFAVAAILSEFDLHFNHKTPLPIVHDSFHLFDVPEKDIYVDFVPRKIIV